jgi:hypothetical protein
LFKSSPPLYKHSAYAHHGVIAALAFAINDLLVSQHRAKGRAPVDWHLCLVCQATLEQLQEYPLSPPESSAIAAQQGSSRAATMHVQQAGSYASQASTPEQVAAVGVAAMAAKLVVVTHQ